MTITQHRALVCVLGTLIAAASAWPQANPPADSRAASSAQPGNGAGQAPSADIRVDVKLVNVFATVTDSNGTPVANLKKENFQLFEDDVPQKIAVFSQEPALPISVVLAIDTSLSTRLDLPFELESARRFAHSIVNGDRKDALSLYCFSREVQEMVSFTSNLERIDQAIDRVHVGSSTAMYDAIYLGAEALEKRQGRKIMVVITDGGDTGSQVSYADALREAQQAEALLYAVIVVPIEASAGRNTGGEHALIQMSNDTGGKYYYADSITRLDHAFRQISDELRNQYLLAYYPSQRLADSDFRRIEVRVLSPATNASTSADRPQLEVRHRTGYYTSKSR
jgi:Ca-activated chloride channel family protein